MQKCVWVNIDLNPDDIANTIKDADTTVQECILYKLAKIHYNHPVEFKIQLQGIADSIKEDYSHDARNIIRYMIQDIADYLGDNNEN